jgi:AcrR family transcriptional regulator
MVIVKDSIGGISMPKAFSEHERIMINAKLHEKGRELMAKFGIRKTSVEDITKAAGISKGAFYLFYNSKEELFLGILEEMDAEFCEELWKGLSAKDVNPRKQFKQAFHNVLRVLEKTPELTRFSGEDYQYLIRKLPLELSEEYMKKNEDVIGNFVAQLMREGKIRRGIDLEVAGGLFRAISVLILQKEEVGQQVFNQVFDLFMERAIDYLVEDPKG